MCECVGVSALALTGLPVVILAIVLFVLRSLLFVLCGSVLAALSWFRVAPPPIRLLLGSGPLRSHLGSSCACSITRQRKQLSRFVEDGLLSEWEPSFLFLYRYSLRISWKVSSSSRKARVLSAGAPICVCERVSVYVGSVVGLPVVIFIVGIDSPVCCLSMIFFVFPLHCLVRAHLYSSNIHDRDSFGRLDGCSLSLSPF